MSDAVNPYQSPETQAVSVQSPAVHGALTETMLVYLKGASPWLRFVGIVGFVLAGLTAMWGLVFFALAPVIGFSLADIPGFEAFGGTVGIAAVGVGLYIIGLAAIMFFPSLFSYRFGSRIRSFLRTGTEAELELAFKNNKSLWKFYGILFIVFLAFLPVALIISVIAAVAVSFA